MIIIFLDFDGVTLSYEEPRSSNHALNRPSERVKLFNGDALKALDHLIAAILESKQQVGIVISSDWRHGHSLSTLKETLKIHPFSKYIVGKTSEKDNYTLPDSHRGFRIGQWLIAHHHWQIENFVVLDDCTFDILTRFPNNFVHCKEGVLTLNDAKKAILCVQKKCDVLPPNLQQVYDGKCLNSDLTSRLKLHADKELGSYVNAHLSHLINSNGCCESTIEWSVVHSDALAQSLKTQLARHRLHFAAEMGQLAVIRSFVTNHGSPNICLKNKTLLDFALLGKSEEVALFLIENGGNVFPDKKATLPLAIKMGLLSVVKKLISLHPEELNAPNEDGLSALCFAAKYGHQHIVEYLLSLADVELEPSSPNSPVFWALRESRFGIVRLLEAHSEQKKQAKALQAMSATLCLVGLFSSSPTKQDISVAIPPVLNGISSQMNSVQNNN